ncbi:hypothetical protein EKO04_008509 [Ascochyta lentis]|uniref:Uncharacterized protein n=1 Tax=Ascochyta lentis TaxID=205686 RepID=A0A8H7MG20_9PLEO|nr:hypothetical protein EKO04_008509 [Ascochyta lentis]
MKAQQPSPPTTFVPSNTFIYAKHSAGLWQPTQPTIFIIMKSTYCHPTISLSNQSIEPVAHCPTLEAVHQALEALAQQYPNGVLLKDHEWGWFQIAGEKMTHTFWIKEVGHARALKWMDFDHGVVDDWFTSDTTTSRSVTSEGIGSATDKSNTDIIVQQQQKEVDGAESLSSKDGCDVESNPDKRLSHVFVGQSAWPHR